VGEGFEAFLNNITGRFASPEGIVLSVFDILLTAVIVFLIVIFLKKNNAARIIKYIAALVLLGAVIQGLVGQMPVTGHLFSHFVILTLLIILLLFPQQLRRVLWQVASPRYANNFYTTEYEVSDEALQTAVEDIVRAVQNMSKKDLGALIIVAPDNLPEHILDSGTRLNADLSSPLIECLFNTKAPLHDGAVYVRGGKILAAGCFLPLTQQTNLDKDLGTRHRAAIGVTEQYDHLAIIVSEETGIISVARHGEIERYLDSQTLTGLLKEVYGLKATDDKKTGRRRRIIR
jgi:diadenylate cyclase